MSTSDEDLTPTSALTPDERDLEAPEADAWEQAIPADPAELPSEIRIGPDVNEYDAVEQAQVVELDDEDWE